MAMSSLRAYRVSAILRDKGNVIKIEHSKLFQDASCVLGKLWAPLSGIEGKGDEYGRGVWWLGSFIVDYISPIKFSLNMPNIAPFHRYS